jgi:hypothetical protein
LVNQGTIINRSRVSLRSELVNDGTFDNSYGSITSSSPSGVFSGTGEWIGAGEHGPLAQIWAQGSFDAASFKCGAECDGYLGGFLPDACDPVLDLPVANEWSIDAFVGQNAVARAPETCDADGKRYVFDFWSERYLVVDEEPDPISHDAEYAFEVRTGLELFAFYRLEGSGTPEPSHSAPSDPSAPATSGPATSAPATSGPATSAPATAPATASASGGAVASQTNGSPSAGGAGGLPPTGVPLVPLSVAVLLLVGAGVALVRRRAVMSA